VKSFTILVAFAWVSFCVGCPDGWNEDGLSAMDEIEGDWVAECDDGVDNDRDGAMDCMEERCAYAEACRGPCMQYCAMICGCEGMDEVMEAAGLGPCGDWCIEAIQGIDDEEQCELAMEAFEAAGGCDQLVPS